MASSEEQAFSQSITGSGHRDLRPGLMPPAPDYPIAIPPAKLEQAIELYRSYIEASNSDPLRIRSVSGEAVVFGHVNHKNGPSSSFAGQKVGVGKRKPLTRKVRAKAALHRFLGTCEFCHRQRVPCPLEHHDIAHLEVLYKEKYPVTWQDNESRRTSLSDPFDCLSVSGFSELSESSEFSSSSGFSGSSGSSKLSELSELSELPKVSELPEISELPGLTELTESAFDRKQGIPNLTSSALVGKHSPVDVANEEFLVGLDNGTHAQTDPYLAAEPPNQSSAFGCYSHSQQASMIPTQLSSNLMTRLGDYIDRLITAPVGPDTVRIFYTCSCGKRMHADFPKEHKFEAQSIADNLFEAGVSRRFKIRPRPYDLSGVETATASVIMQATNSTTGDLDTSTVSPDVRTRNSMITRSSMTTTSNSEGLSANIERASSASGLQTPLNTANPRFLLLCIDTSRIGSTGKSQTSLSNIDVTEATVWNDQLLFNKIREVYYSKRRRQIIPLRTPKSMFFVQLELLPLQDNCLSVAVLDNHSLPPAEEVHPKARYHYTPCPTNGVHVPENIFFHAFFEPGVHLHDWCLNRLPKKLNEELKSGGSFGWGIHIVEGPDWYAISIFSAILFLATGIMGVLWSIFNHDVQSGFAIASYLASLVATVVSILFFH